MEEGLCGSTNIYLCRMDQVQGQNTADTSGTHHGTYKHILYATIFIYKRNIP